MAINYNPRIVTDGLVLCLDAGNSKSYPGSGTVWGDLSGRGNNGTLVNMDGTNLSSDNGGSLTFDGSNEYLTLASNPSLTNQVTFETWVKLSSTTPNAIATIFSRETTGSGSYRMLYTSSSFNWVCATTNNGWYSTPGNSISTGSVTPHTQTYQVVGTYNGSNLQLYVNGTLRTTGSSISGNILTDGTYYLMRKEASNTDYGKGNIYSHKIYNRALTAAEIQQNFNATRSRYNI